MTIAEAVVKRIYELVDERQLTINKISTISGITQSTVSDIVNGVTSNVKIATVKKLCDGLDCPFSPHRGTSLFCEIGSCGRDSLPGIRHRH